jgi:hypothetical protein
MTKVPKRPRDLTNGRNTWSISVRARQAITSLRQKSEASIPPHAHAREIDPPHLVPRQLPQPGGLGCVIFEQPACGSTDFNTRTANVRF